MKKRKIFYCPCEGNLDCAFYNPETQLCEMDEPIDNCDAAYFAVFNIDPDAD